jgi:hypothetical protein
LGFIVATKSKEIAVLLHYNTSKQNNPDQVPKTILTDGFFCSLYFLFNKKIRVTEKVNFPFFFINYLQKMRSLRKAVMKPKMVWLLGNIRYCFAASIILVGFGCVRKVKKWLSATIAFLLRPLRFI